jgi:septal ring factor EnvC (AmiA/AmiB activator)
MDSPARSSLLALALLVGACEFTLEIDPGESAGPPAPEQWRARAAPLEQRVESLERRIEQVREERWDLPASFDASIEARSEQLEREIEQLEAQLEQAQDELSALEDRAREAGVPPGWLR